MISAILLAAGSSRRMGAINKLLLPFQQSTILETVIDHLLELSQLELIVVLGHQSEEVRTAIGELPVRTVFNPNHLKMTFRY